jgi:hypothetical protein
MKGIYTLPAEGKGIDTTMASASFITGYSIRVSWKSLEPTKGAYNWKVIDNALNLARKNDKYIVLRILAGAFSPDWVMAQPNVPKLEYVETNKNKPGYGTKISLPVPWDSNYLNLYYTFLGALSKWYSTEPKLYWVAVSGPVLGAATPYLSPDSGTLAIMYTKGLTAYKWEEVWKEAIDRTATLFPLKAISLCLDVPPSYPYIAERLAEYAVTKYGKRICLQSNGLSSKVLDSSYLIKNPEAASVFSLFPKYKDKAIIGFQMTWAAAWEDGAIRVGPLDQAIDAGIALGARYLEIYQDDILNPANAIILTDASKRLKEVI